MFSIHRCISIWKQNPGKVRQDRGSALHSVLLISILLSLTILILLGSYLKQLRYNRDGLEEVQASYHAESGIVKWLKVEKNDNRPYGFESSEATLSLPCQDSVTIRFRRWGVFQRIISREYGRSDGICATIGYANVDEISSGLIVEPLQQSLIVCEDTRLYCDVICGPQGVRSQHLQGVLYSGEKPVYGRVVKSGQDFRPKIQYADVRKIIAYYLNTMSNRRRSQLSELPLSTKNEIRLSNDRVYETGEHFNTDSSITIRGPGKIVVTDAVFFKQKLNIRNEVEILLSDSCRIGSEVKLRNVVIFSTFPLMLRGLEAEQLQVISTNKIRVGGKTRLTENSVLLSMAEQGGTRITLSGQSTVFGSVCLVSGSKHPAEWANSIQISRGARVTGLVYSDWLLDISGEVTGSCVTSRFYFYQSPTHYFNWIRNATIRQDKHVTVAVPLFFDISSTGKSVIYRERI